MGLLPRMEARVWASGKKVTYRYHPTGGKPINLGTDRDEAIRKVLALRSQRDNHGTIAELWLAYQQSPYWHRLSDLTKKDYTGYARVLLGIMGTAHVSLVTPAVVVRYLRRERADAPVRANREIALLSNLMTIAIERGDITTNPCKQVKRNKETPRDNLPNEADLAAFLAWLEQHKSERWAVIALMVRFAATTGCRRVEFLGIKLAQIDLPRRVLTMQRAKQRGRVIMDTITIPDGMVPLMQEVLALPRPDESDLVFTTRTGNAYTPQGFSTMFYRAQVEASESGVIKSRFTFHDLRAYYASRHKMLTGMLPDLHADPGLTARVYDRTKVSERSGLAE